jgi:hypothetical protein
MYCFESSRFVKSAAVVVILILVLSAGAYAQSRPGKSELNFLYAFGAQTGAQAGGKIIPVQNETTLRSGDRLKLFVEPKAELYFYLVHLSSQGDLTPLFPVDSKPARIAPGSQVFLPEGSQWYELDAHPGAEKFFMLVSAERLERLEELCGRHVTLKDKSETQSSADAILDEIKRLRQKHKQLSAPAEKPVRIGGSVRGEQPSSSSAAPDVTPLAAEVTAAGFYSRTFSIDHR